MKSKCVYDRVFSLYYYFLRISLARFCKLIYLIKTTKRRESFFVVVISFPIFSLFHPSPPFLLNNYQLPLSLFSSFSLLLHLLFNLSDDSFNFDILFFFKFFSRYYLYNYLISIARLNYH